MAEQGASELYWDEETKRYLKYDADKDRYFTDDETRQADAMQPASDAEEEKSPQGNDTEKNEQQTWEREGGSRETDRENATRTGTSADSASDRKKNDTAAVSAKGGADEIPPGFMQEYEEMKNEIGALENTIADLEMIVERSIMEKEAAEDQAEESKQMNADLKLHLDLARTEKELKEMELQEQKLLAEKTELRLQENMQAKASAEEQLAQYKEAFESLKTWHVELSQLFKVKEAELIRSNKQIETLQLQLQQLKADAEVGKQAIMQYEELMDTTGAVIKEHQNMEVNLKSRLADCQNELYTYKEAWVALANTLKERETNYRSQIVALSAENADLTEKNKKMQTLTAPRWQRAAVSRGEGEEKAEKTKRMQSNAALILGNRVAKLEALVLSEKLQLLTECVPEKVVVHIQKALRFVAAAHKCYYKCCFLLQYLTEAHFKELIEDALSNRLAVSKDKGFIRWLASFNRSASKAAYWMARYLEMFRMSESSELSNILNLPDHPLETAIEAGEAVLDKYLKSSQADFLSAAIDISPLEHFVSQLEGISVSFEGSLNMRGDKVLVNVSRALVFEVYGSGVLGLCHATYVEEASDAFPPEHWHHVANKCYEILNWLCTEDLSDLFNATCDALQPRNASGNLLATLKNGVDKLEEVIFSIEEKSSSDFSIVMRPVMRDIETCLEEVEYAVTHSAPKRRSELPPAPWMSICQEILALLANVTFLESKIVETNQLLDVEKNAHQKAKEEMTKMKEEARKWESRYKDARLKAEMSVVLERDLSRMTREKSQYVEMLNNFRTKLASAVEERDRKVREHIDVIARLDETSRKLESAKKMSRHQFQNEHHSKEIANLRSIVQKLDRELFTTQMKKAEKNRDLLDMPYVPTERGMKLALPGGESDSEPSTVEELPSKRVESHLLSAVTSQFGEEKPLTLNDMLKMLHEYRQLQQAALTHSFQIPIWDPNVAPAENEMKMQRYRNEHDALQLKITSLQKKIDKHISTTLESARSKRCFDDHASVSASRYMKQFTELSGIDNHALVKPPVARVTLPKKPEWLPDTCGSVQRLIVTEEQLARLHRKIVGC